MLLALILALLPAAALSPSPAGAADGKPNRRKKEKRKAAPDKKKKKPPRKKRRPSSKKGADSLGAVTVRADPEFNPDDKDVSSFVTVVDTRKETGRVRDVADVLDSNAGVKVRRSGGPGSFSAVSIRGSSVGQVLILLDGTPLNTGATGTINLGDLPLDSLERVEVYRGFSPPYLGGGAIGGVVNLVTRRPPGHTLSGMTVSYGSFGTRKLNFYQSQRLKKLSFTAFVNYVGTNGDFPFYNTNGTDLNTDDDSVSRRSNNVKDTLNLSGRMVYRVSRRLKLKLSDNFTFGRSGLAGVAHISTRSASLRIARNLLQAEVTALRFPHKRMRVDGALYHLLDDQHFKDRFGELVAGSHDGRTMAGALGGRARLMWFPWRSSEMSLSVDLRHETFRPENKLMPEYEPATRSRTTFSPGLMWVLGLWKNRIMFSPSGRLGLIRNDYRGKLPFAFKGAEDEGEVETTLKPTGRVGLKLKPVSWFWLKGNIGTYIRQPTFLELFGMQGTTMGNPDLQPETGANWDAGAVLFYKGQKIVQQLRLEYALFQSRTKQLITFVQNSQHTVMAVNIEGARTTGHEVKGRLTLFGHLRLEGDLTLLDTENLTETKTQKGKKLPGRPDVELTVKAALFARWGRLFYQFQSQGGNFVDAENYVPLPARYLHSAGVRLVVGPLMRLLGLDSPKGLEQASLTLEVRNIFDVRMEELEFIPKPPAGWPQKHPEPISDYIGYPLPGRAFYFTFDWKG